MKYIIRESLNGIIRQKFSSMLLAFIIALCVFCLGGIFTVVYNTDKLQNRWAEDIRIVIFPSDTIGDKQQLLDNLKAIKGVKEVKSISSEEANGILRKRFPDEDILLSSTIIPEFMEITAASGDVEGIVSELRKSTVLIDDVIVNDSWLKSLTGVLSMLKYSAFLTGAFILVLSLLLLSYSARIDAVHRKGDMDIYRLCGATEWYIRMPYITGGAIIGLAGAILGIVSFFILRVAFKGIILHFSSVFISDFDYSEMPFFVFALLFIFGPVLGALGSLFCRTRSE